MKPWLIVGLTVLGGCWLAWGVWIYRRLQAPTPETDDHEAEEAERRRRALGNMTRLESYRRIARGDPIRRTGRR